MNHQHESWNATNGKNSRLQKIKKILKNVEKIFGQFFKVSRFRQKNFFEFFIFSVEKKEKIENKSHFRHKLLIQDQKIFQAQNLRFLMAKKKFMKNLLLKVLKVSCLKK